MTLSIPHSDAPSPGSAGYDPAAIERKWQARWQEARTNSPDLRHGERPFYQLMMFPYPSAEGLHIGNLYAFTGNDIHGRFQRLQGHTVFEPIGYDAFGIHSENYALKVGVHPSELIPRNIANFRRQLRRAGLMVDWEHELATTDPSYYKWTQWVFLKLYEKGLAYKKKAAVNWCPFDKTVLANEQVIAGACERCGTAVEQRFLEQWFFRITDYAARLLANLDWIDWSESTKTAQRNWIGKSEGAEIDFEVRGTRGEGREPSIEPARPSSLAPRPSIRVFTTRPDTIFGATYMVLAPEHPLVERITTPEQRAAVSEYRERTVKQDLVTRKVADKEKTGVFTGAYAVNPATGGDIPVWIADYVLMEYGTGAIMAVPGHDERDYEFARKFGLPIVRVVAGAGEGADTPLEAAFADDEAGRLVNSGRFDGMAVPEAKRAITIWLAEEGAAAPVVNYRLHDWCISRQRYWGPPIPVIYCDTCGVVPVPERDLPVLLPPIEDFRPDDTGVSPLARHEEWYRAPCPKCGGDARRETDVSDTFLDSAWYFLRYPSSERDDVPFDPELTRKWLPVDSYIGGNEHAVLHLLYTRFVTMVLHDMGFLAFEEPFKKFRAHGMIIREGAKMSKSRGNVVNPDEYIEQWGADAFRAYLMFLGPFEEGGDFRDAGISGVRRFLDRLWRSATEARADGEPDVAVMRKLHQTIRKVGEDIPRLSFNTAIAAMMEYMNVLRAGERTPHRAEVAPLVRLVAPFAPHIAEELWERGGGAGSVFDAGWPAFDPALAAEDEIELVVQVNGKVRGRIRVARDVGQEAAVAAALADAGVAKFATGAPRKVVFVPGRLLNLVV
ncbi:MAG TPA: leucine--tRNA ligase [Gemmatimonadaceae bacterium]|nr:leucine--tRNA ligase [Gemmatimonadaceae bacterium]